ncbi:uncharacterized protein [Antedon mediterranea]|uniref:uncharacterized protein n=1 Tax=Antedon mediterranea TaxID=105859 RepID=UPI003AF41C07
MEKRKKDIKILRRNRKGQLTRITNTINVLCQKEELERDIELIQNLLKKANEVFETVERAHEQIVEMINLEDEEQFEEAEKWMQDCQRNFLEVIHETKRVLEPPVRGTVTEETDRVMVEEDSENVDQGEKDGNNKVNSNDMDAMATFKLALELPKAEVIEFHGDPGNYWAFVQSFEINVASKLTSDNAKLQYLLQLCKNKAKESIVSCPLLGEEGYKQALEILKRQFGQPHLVLNSLMLKLTNRKEINAGNHEELWGLVSDMKKCQLTLTKMGYTNDLNSTSNLLKIQGLLPRFMQAKWANAAQSILSEREPSFLDMLKFVESQAAVNSNMFGRNISTTANENKSKFRVVNTDFRGKKAYSHSCTPTGEKPSESPFFTCVCCKKNHRLWECVKFRQLSINERWNIASQEKLCFKCLCKHRAVDCKRVMSCGINGCKNDHNRLLHREKVKKESNFETVEVGVAREGERKVTKTETGTNTTLLSKNQSIALRTIPIIVSNGKKRIEVNALLDDGSTQTYVNEELCGELGLSGVTEEMVVSLLSGKEERFVTKPVEIFVLPLDGSKKFKVNAVTISDVTGRLEASDWSSVSKDWDHLRDIEFPVISSQRKEIDLLIGVDCPELHTALEEKKVKKESNFETVEVGVAREGERKVTKTETGTNTTLLSKNQSIALRTIPIIVSNGKKRIEVNALLDDGL